MYQLESKAILNENSLRVLRERGYLHIKENGTQETPEEMFRRVAKTVAEAEYQYGASEFQVREWEDKFYEMMVNLDFLPNTPTLINAGKPGGQIAACFVLSIDDNMRSIFETLRDCALIHQGGGGTGMDFSSLRPKGDIVKTTNGIASGPLSFLEVYNSATEAVIQGGARRGASMAVLRVDHPDILDFIEVKKTEERLTNFNLSVAVTDDFMRAVRAKETYPIINPRNNEVVKYLDANMVLDKIVEATHASGEPGVLFIDTINKANPTPRLGNIRATNPCAEEPLLAGESCVLGSINLVNMLEPTSKEINWGKLARTVELGVRFLDNTIDVNCFPLSQIEEMTKANRKIGLGIMGFGDMLIRMGIRYDSYEGLEQAANIMSFINDGSREVSYQLAEERGEFPNWEDSIFSEKRRNAALTCVAPTGSVSTIAGCSSGLEPIFSVAMKRNIIDSTLTEVNREFQKIIYEYGNGLYDDMVDEIINAGSIQNIKWVPQYFKDVFVTARDIAPGWHIRMQAEFQKHVEGSLSKTVNLPNSATKEDVRNVYLMAYEMGCKSVTLYRDGSREKQVLVTGKKETEMPVRSRSEIIKGMTRKIKTGCGNLFVTINHYDDEGNPFEIFSRLGKTGACAAAQTESTGRLCALALRSGVEPAEIVDQLRGISCDHPWGVGPNKVTSCSDAVAKVLADYIGMGQPSGNGHKDVEYPVREETHIIIQGACPQCGSGQTKKSHCGGVSCLSCGYEECN